VQAAVEEAAEPEPVEAAVAVGEVCVGAGWVGCSAVGVGLTPPGLVELDPDELTSVGVSASGWAVGLACPRLAWVGPGCAAPVSDWAAEGGAGVEEARSGSAVLGAICGVAAASGWQALSRNMKMKTSKRVIRPD